MRAELLKIKLSPPQLWPSLVVRSRLVAKLENGLDLEHGSFVRRLTLVSGQAGFGKTTLVRAWLASTGRPFAWVSLDETDNDPSLFWNYLCTAVEDQWPGVGKSALSLLGDAHTANSRLVLTGLLNSLSAREEAMIVVLDDFHVIEEKSILEGLAYFLEYLPANTHLVVTTRVDPPISLARLRAQGALLEVGEGDLRFSAAESADFLRRTMDLDLTDEHISVLEKRTGGWIAGLQLAALSLGGSPDVDHFIETFEGLERTIVEFLIKEVLHNQPADLQEFLLRTSILENLAGPLCDAVTGMENGRAMLNAAAKANLFLVPLDYEGRWYRYHRLFAKFLRQQLRFTYPDVVAVLHKRASRWYREEGYFIQAVSHAFYAEDEETAGLLIEERFAQVFFKTGEIPLVTLKNWIDKLPRQTLRNRPRLALTSAWAYLWSGHATKAESLAREAEHLLALRENGIEVEHYRGELAVFWANLAYLSGNGKQTAFFAAEALALLPVDDYFMRSLSYLMLGQARRLEKRPLVAREAYARAAAIGRDRGILTTGLLATGFLVRVETMMGKLKQAKVEFDKGLAMATEAGFSPPALGVAQISMGDVYREWNELEKATNIFREGIRLCRQWQGLGATVLDGLIGLAKTYIAAGNELEAQGIINQALDLTRSDPLHNEHGRVMACQVRLWLVQDNEAAAWEWSQRYATGSEKESGGSPVKTNNEEPDLILARLLIRRKQSIRALALLEPMLETAERDVRMASLIEIQAVMALALHQAGRFVESLECLAEALKSGEEGLFVRTFVDLGPEMAKLLRQAAKYGLTIDYVNFLLSAHADDERRRVAGGAQSKSEVVGQPLAEPLTERELEVLRLIAVGLKNKEIAEELVVVLGTVKAHINNIYGKLGVKNRIQAVNRGRELNLI